MGHVFMDHAASRTEVVVAESSRRIYKPKNRRQPGIEHNNDVHNSESLLKGAAGESDAKFGGECAKWYALR